MRQLKDQFLKEFFKGGQFYEIINMVKTDPFLDVELRGDCVIIYYRGGKLLTINDPYANNQKDLLEKLDKNYIPQTSKESCTRLNPLYEYRRLYASPKQVCSSPNLESVFVLVAAL